MSLFPRFQLRLSLISRDPVTFLDLAGQHRTLPFNYIQIIVGKLAPLLLNMAFELFPVAFQNIAIHKSTP
jgi:hypothetical protein